MSTSTSPSTSTISEHDDQLRVLLNGPAAKPPPRVAPNLEDPANLNRWVTLTIILCVSLGTLAVASRIYTKRYIMKAFEREDYVTLLAWLGQTGEIIPSGLVVKYGGGVHMWDIRLRDFFPMLYLINISSIVYTIVVFLVKLSILLQYLRIFAPTKRGNMFIFVGAHLVIWTMFIFYFIETVLEICICTPREKIWNPLMEGGHCFNQYIVFQITGVFNVVSDVAILLLPLPSIWQLHMPWRKKILTTGVFATGIFACATSILRTYYTWKFVESPDISYNVVRLGLWTNAELTTGIIISCLPIMPRFFRHLGTKITRSLSLGAHSPGTGSKKMSTKDSSRPHPSWAAQKPNLSRPIGVADCDRYCWALSPQDEYVMLRDGRKRMMTETSKEIYQLPPRAKFSTNYDLEDGVARC